MKSFLSWVKNWKTYERLIELEKIQQKLVQLDTEADAAGESEIQVRNEIEFQNDSDIEVQNEVSLQ